MGWTKENHSLGFHEAGRLHAASGCNLGQHNCAPGVTARVVHTDFFPSAMLIIHIAK